MPASRTLATLFTAAAVLAPGQLAQAGTDTAVDPGPLERGIERRMADSGIVGLGAAIIIDRKVVWTRGFGHADRERATPFTPDSTMNIASISKTFTGAALMHAVQAGKLDLDEHVNAYLPFRLVNPNFPDDTITLRQLATHTAGIVDRPAAYASSYHYGGDAPQSLAQFLRAYFVPGEPLYAQANFLAARPGRVREYSNIGAALAGYIVELAVGERLDRYTRRHIFQPLRMDHSGWFLADMDTANHSRLYLSQGGMTVPIPLYGLATYPDGGVRTSVSDLSRFLIALLGDGALGDARILDPGSAREMLRFQYTEASKPDNVNIAGEDSVNSGIFWATKRDMSQIGHNGSDPGVATMMLSNLSRDVAVILFANTSLCEHDSGHHDIFGDLWRHAVALKAAGRPVADGPAGASAAGPGQVRR